MNTPNNNRRKESRKRMGEVFVRLLQERELEKVTVTEICRQAGVNRTTFYANYVDIYDLADAVKERLNEEILSLYAKEVETRQSSHNFLPLFRHIKENKLFYQTYFKLGLDSDYSQFIGYDMEEAAAYYGGRHVEYHMEFFRCGLNAIIQKWLQEGCRETPEEMNEILMEEYLGKRKIG